ncbi:MAG: hypothetical protein GX128_07815 [Bacteroidales bacterium]|nr:hypothetical protein [Bacteroidales bacterium]
MKNGNLVTDIYLSELIRAGYYPKTIILIHPKTRTVNKKYKILSFLIGKQKANKLFIFNNSKKQYKRRKAFQNVVDVFLPKNIFEIRNLKMTDILNKLNVISIESDNFNSDELINCIKSNIKGVILVGASGILKREILSIPDVKFINIHSGIVPNYKGLDNFFYSLLYNDPLGCSIFYIDEGIDTGKLIFKKKVQLLIDKGKLKEINHKEIHYAIKYYVKSYYKITVFIEYLNDSVKKYPQLDLMNLSSYSQDKNVGRVFYELHPEMEILVIDKIISK